MPEIPNNNGQRPPKGGGGSPPPGGTIIKLEPRQIAGLVPMLSCTASECRDPFDLCGFPLVVYGEIIAGVPTATSTYENDFSSFLVEQSLFATNPTATITWTLEKCTVPRLGTYETVATLNGSTYGSYAALNSIVNHSTYSYVVINWAKVLKLLGVGTYRIKATTALGARSACLVSPGFQLRAWDCERAHKTVKWESYLSGIIGDVNSEKTFDLCGMNYHESLRITGFFGLETTAYSTEEEQYPTGLTRITRDQAMRQYRFISGLWPKQYHDRLKVYGFMANSTYVSDYNINNSDYGIRQKLVLKGGAYNPEWNDKDWQRKAGVEIEMKAGYQNLITSICCSTELPHG